MRLIDADALKRLERYEKTPLEDEVIGWNAAVDYIIECEPTIDAVPVVRCKDCKHFKRDIPCVGGAYNGCDQLEGRDGCEPYVEEDFFCAYGERRTDG